MSLLYVVRHSVTPGRFCVDGIDINSGDLIAFIDGNTVLQGRIEHRERAGAHVYFVVAQDGRALPLSQIFFARHVNPVELPLRPHRKAVQGRLRHRRG